MPTCNTSSDKADMWRRKSNTFNSDIHTPADWIENDFIQPARNSAKFHQITVLYLFLTTAIKSIITNDYSGRNQDLFVFLSFMRKSELIISIFFFFWFVCHSCCTCNYNDRYSWQFCYFKRPVVKKKRFADPQPIRNN